MSLIPFEIVDPTQYYNGSAKSFVKRFYVGSCVFSGTG